jgi:hypothetical protein
MLSATQRHYQILGPKVAYYHLQELLGGGLVPIKRLNPPAVLPDYRIIASVIDESADGVILSTKAGGTVTGSGVYRENSLVTLTAAANHGYEFLGWFRGGIRISKNPVYKFTAVEDANNGNRNSTSGKFAYEARFKAIDPPADPALSSTDITKGGVLIDGVDYNLVEQADGTWLVTVPYGTDLSKLALTFNMPHANAKIDPANGTQQDFSDGKPVAYTVTSADGKKTQEYDVLVMAAPYQIIDRDIVDPLPQSWTISETHNADGTFSFVLTAPVDSWITSLNLPSQIYVTITPTFSDLAIAILDKDGAVLSPYLNDPIVHQTGEPPVVLRMTGIASDRGELEALSIARIDYAFIDDVGKSYKQEFDPAITYDTIPNTTVDPNPIPPQLPEPPVEEPPQQPGPLPRPQPAPGSSGGGGGCATEALALPALLVVAAFAALRGRRK